LRLASLRMTTVWSRGIPLKPKAGLSGAPDTKAKVVGVANKVQRSFASLRMTGVEGARHWQRLEVRIRSAEEKGWKVGVGGARRGGAG